jgi:hypothetical protein
MNILPKFAPETARKQDASVLAAFALHDNAADNDPGPCVTVALADVSDEYEQAMRSFPVR